MWLNKKEIIIVVIVIEREGSIIGIMNGRILSYVFGVFKYFLYIKNKNGVREKV